MSTKHRSPVKLLVAISSCRRDQVNGANQSIRDTWAPDLPAGVDYKFFVGEGAEPLKDDEIQLSVPDTYVGLAWKTRESLRWSLGQDYTHVYRAFTDTYIIGSTWMHKMQKENWECYDLVGVIPTQPEPNGWFYPFGGSGYMTSRRANEAIVKHPVPEPVKGDWESFAEDVWLGMALKPFMKSWLLWKPISGMGMTVEHYHPGVATMHLSKGDSNYENTPKYDVAWMYEAHKKVKGIL